MTTVTIIIHVLKCFLQTTYHVSMAINCAASFRNPIMHLILNRPDRKAAFTIIVANIVKVQPSTLTSTFTISQKSPFLRVCCKSLLKRLLEKKKLLRTCQIYFQFLKILQIFSYLLPMQLELL